jgi:hypothetical protein
MNNNYDKIIWIILFFVFLIIIGLYISELTPLNLDQKKKALDLDIITEDFTNSSSTNDQTEGASELYKWGLPKDNDDSLPNDSNNDCNNESNNNNWWSTWWNNLENGINKSISTDSNDNSSCENRNINLNNTNLKNGVNLYKHYNEVCTNYDITKNKDIDKYVLKSSVPPCQDTSEFVTKNMMNANPDLSDYILKSEIKPCDKEKNIDLSHYVLKSAIPACPTCPICPECPICPICPIQDKSGNNKNNEKKVYEYNITDHPDISKYLSIDEVNKNYMKKEDCKNSSSNNNANNPNNNTNNNKPTNIVQKQFDYNDTMPSVEKERTKKTETDRSNSGMYKQFTEKIFSEDLNENDFKILSGDGYYAGDNLYAAV